MWYSINLINYFKFSREGKENVHKDKDGTTVQDFITRIQTEFPDAKFEITTAEDGNN